MDKTETGKEELGGSGAVGAVCAKALGHEMPDLFEEETGN